MTEREFAIDVVRRLQEAGHVAYWAGGCVRDEILGLQPLDFDVASDARPEQVRALFKRTIAVGLSFGVVEVLGPAALKVQVATFRTDGGYSDGRRPDSVEFTSAQEDARRRDFTINGMFFDPIANLLIDFVGGQEDLVQKRLRAIGDPVHRFTEDKLRMLRAVRMATRFDLEIEPATAEAIRAMASQIDVVSAERIADETRKLLVHPRRSRGVALLEDLGLLPAILPETRGADRRPFDALDQKPTAFPLAFAALLAPLDAPSVNAIARRLKLSNDERERIAWLVDNQSVLDNAPDMRLSKLKPLLAHPGVDELLTLHRARGRSMEFCETMIRETPREVLDPPPLLTGHDLLERGVPAGPRMKQQLAAVRDAQLDEKIQTREEALALLTLPGAAKD
jgi:poly(A) polymerase